jgi:membrane protein
MMLPEGSFAIVQDEVGRVVEKEGSSLGLAFAFGLLFAIWSANSGTKAIIDALNVADEEEEVRGFFKLNLVSLGFTVAGLIAVLIMVGAVVVVPLVLRHIGPDALVELLLQIGRWPVLALALLTALMVLYRYGPSRRPPGWRCLSVGSVVAIVLWLIGSSLLSWYLSNFASYTATYGSLGAAIGLMMWMWMSATIILVGAELNSEIQRQAVDAKGRAGSDQGPAAIDVPG